MARPVLVLASASPRRRRLIDELGLPLEVRPARVDESRPTGSVEERVQALAHWKAETVATTLDEGFVLGADTLGSMNGTALGKPADEQEALRILWQLAGRTHEVLSGVTVLQVADRKIVRCAEAVTRTRVTFRQLGLRDIQAYVDTGEFEDKAGAYAIQGTGRALVESIDGSYTNVVGLPVATTLHLLAEVDYPVPDIDVTPMEVLPPAAD